MAPLARQSEQFCGRPGSTPLARRARTHQIDELTRAHSGTRRFRRRHDGARKGMSLHMEDMIMLNYDFSPFYRSTVGFDRLLSLLDKSAGLEASAPAYPPYNIERTGENAYRITLAVAGFAESELSVETRENTLTVRGAKDAQQKARREARRALPGHRRARFRAPLPSCRPRQRGGRDLREWSAAHRPRARSARGAEAARHSDPGARRKTIEGTPSPPRRPSRPP